MKKKSTWSQNPNDVEKAFDKIEHLFMTKTLRKLGIENNFPNLIKGIYENPTANILLNERLKAYFKIRIKDVCTHHFFSTLY